MYEFGEDVGGLDRSRYFGFSKDLYHFDHFMGAAAFPVFQHASMLNSGTEVSKLREPVQVSSPIGSRISLIMSALRLLPQLTERMARKKSLRL